MDFFPAPSSREDAERALAELQTKKWVTKAALARELSVSQHTVDRWRRTPVFEFPRPFAIGQKLFFLRPEIDVWKARAAAAFRVGKAAPP